MNFRVVIFSILFFNACMSMEKEVAQELFRPQFRIILNKIINDTKYEIQSHGITLESKKEIELQKQLTLTDNEINLEFTNGLSKANMVFASLKLNIKYNPATHILDITLKNNRNIRGEWKTRMMDFKSINLATIEFAKRGLDIYITLIIKSDYFLEHSSLTYQIRPMVAETLKGLSTQAVAKQIINGQFTLEQAKKILPTDLHEKLEKELARLQ